MHLAPRLQDILDRCRLHGYQSIDELAHVYAVTPQTIRRDINSLAAQGLLRRTHGGAAAPESSTRNTAYALRAQQMHEQKRRIAEAVAAHVPDRASVAITVGTTTEAIARALLKRRSLKVITNNLHVAILLSTKADFEVLIAAGTVRSDGGVIGAAAVEFFQQFKVDYALMGISGIDIDGTLLDFDPDEVRVTQAVMRHARQRILAADSSKFGRNALVRVGHLTQCEHLVTDQPLSLALSQQFEDSALNVEVV